MSTKQAETKEGIEKRTIRAATESMSLDRHAGEPGEYDVYSESGNVYRVFLLAGDCDCPSATYQDGPCKHQRRVEMALGQRDVPDLDEEIDVERMIAAREEYRGLGDSTVEHRPADDAVVVTDGGADTLSKKSEPADFGGGESTGVQDLGTMSDEDNEDDAEPEITRHVEPESQAIKTGEPATYYRCECGTEAMREQDLKTEAHREECGAQ